MSSSNTNTPVINAPVVAEKKPRVVKPKLSTKYSKFLEFGYVFVQSLHGKGTLSDEGLESAYSELKLFDEAESQTEFYEQVLVQCKETGKSMRKFVTQRNKPPKAVKARKPRAKKEEVEVAASSEAVEGGEARVTARTPEQLARLTSLVKDAVGFSAERGDTVSIVNAPFTVPASIPATTTLSLSMPAAFIARIAPIAISSLLAITASNGSPALSQLVMMS